MQWRRSFHRTCGAASSSPSDKLIALLKRAFVMVSRAGGGWLLDRGQVVASSPLPDLPIRQEL